jgi:sialidase-1
MFTRIGLAAVIAILGMSHAKGAEAEVVGHRTIYSDERYYSAFPSIVRRPDGELIVAFRRAPERRLHGAKDVLHTDANSYLVLSRSRDEGTTWSPLETFFAHPMGGSQDPCLLQLRDGSLYCTTYTWTWIDPANRHTFADKLAWHEGSYAFIGGFTLRSPDGGKSWEGPFRPASVKGERRTDIFGEPIGVYNRGELVEGRDGRLYWAVAVRTADDPRHTEVHLMVSDDKGLTWRYGSLIARDPKVAFNETSLYETPDGALVAFLRTANYDDQLCIARSVDGGKTFQPWKSAGFKGHPAQALRVAGQRVLLVYGYRHKPYGIRARILNAECTDAETSQEIVLRDDGGNTDLGYPWSVPLSDGRVLVVYYFNRNNGTRSIESTTLRIK